MNLEQEEKNRIIQCLEFDTEDLKLVITDFERDNNKISLKSPRTLKCLLELNQRCISKLKEEWRIKKMMDLLIRTIKEYQEDLEKSKVEVI